MTTPSFVDRITTAVSIEVVNITQTAPLSKFSSSAVKQVLLAGDAINTPDAGTQVLDNANIVVRSSDPRLKGVNFAAKSTFKLVGVTGGELYIDVPISANSRAVISQTPTIFVDTIPQVVYWS